MAAPILITQSSALAGGVTPGDTPGFPVTLADSGSFVLDGNLTASGQAAILVTASDVTLDLNGFSITGGGSCSAGTSTGNTCTGTPTSTTLVRSNAARFTIKNGSVKGTTGDGIQLFDDNAVYGVDVAMHRGNGITCTASSPITIADSALSLNANGMNSECIATLRNVRASYNTNYGIYSTKGSMVDVVASNNTGVGVLPGFSSVDRAYASNNGSDGIWGGSVIKDSVAKSNGGVGFRSNSGGLYFDSQAYLNTGSGFDFSVASNCYSNIFAASNGGTQIVGGTALNGTKVTCP
jgi:hypothetical protein